MTKQTLVPTTIRIPSTILERIDYVIEGTGKTRADFVREAIIEHLEEAEKRKKVEMVLRKLGDFLGKEESPTYREIKELKESIEVIINGGSV